MNIMQMIEMLIRIKTIDINVIHKLIYKKKTTLKCLVLKNTHLMAHKNIVDVRENAFYVFKAVVVHLVEMANFS